MDKKKLEVQNSFTKLYAPVMMATSITNVETAVVVEFNIYDKVIYSYVHQQSLWFKEYDKVLFESQDSVARCLGIDRKTVNKSLKKLESVGAIVKKKQAVNGSIKTTYSSLDLCSDHFRLNAEITHREYRQKPVTEIVEICVVSLDCEQKVLDKPKKPQYTKPQPIKPAPKVGWIEDDEDKNCPF